jgi:hypothetical protein
MGALKTSLIFVLVWAFGLMAHLVALGVLATSIPQSEARQALAIKKARKEAKKSVKVLKPIPKVQITIKKVPKKVKSSPKKPSPIKVRVSSKLLRRGKKLAGKDAARMGTFPGLSAEFQDTLGWAAYWSAMESLGASFFIYDGVLGKIICEISGDECEQPHSFDGLSPRSRDISHLQEAKSLIARFSLGREKRLILLLPLEMDQIILAVQERAAWSKKIRLSKFTRFSGIYQLKNESLILKITGATMTTGKRVALDVEVNLGRVS